MNTNNIDWLKFALELYEKTKDMGLVNNWTKENLNSLIEAAGRFNPAVQGPPGTGKTPEGTKTVDVAKEKAEEFWQQESAFPHGGATGPEAAKAGHSPPISIYETVKEVSISVVLPGVASRDELSVFLTPETLELSGARSAGGVPGSRGRENFSKKIRLPAPVEPSLASAAYRSGFLYISAPKKVHSPFHKVEVRFE